MIYIKRRNGFPGLPSESWRQQGKNVARLRGLEPLTYGLEVRCSIQLSYRRAVKAGKKKLFRTGKNG